MVPVVPIEPLVHLPVAVQPVSVQVPILCCQLRARRKGEERSWCISVMMMLLLFLMRLRLRKRKKKVYLWMYLLAGDKYV